MKGRRASVRRSDVVGRPGSLDEAIESSRLLLVPSDFTHTAHPPPHPYSNPPPTPLPHKKQKRGIDLSPTYLYVAHLSPPHRRLIPSAAAKVSAVDSNSGTPSHDSHGLHLSSRHVRKAQAESPRDQYLRASTTRRCRRCRHRRLACCHPIVEAIRGNTRHPTLSLPRYPFEYPPSPPLPFPSQS